MKRQHPNDEDFALEFFEELLPEDEDNESSDSSATEIREIDPDKLTWQFSIHDEVHHSEINNWITLIDMSHILDGGIKQYNVGYQLCIEIQIIDLQNVRRNHRIYLNEPLSNRVCGPLPHLYLLRVEVHFGRIFVLVGGYVKSKYILDQVTGNVDTHADYSLFREQLDIYLKKYSWGTKRVSPAEYLPSDKRIERNQFITFVEQIRPVVALIKQVSDDAKGPKRARTEGYSIKLELDQIGKKLLELLRRLDNSIALLVNIKGMALILDPSDVCQPGDFAPRRMTLYFALGLLEVIRDLREPIKKLAIENAADQNAGRNTQPDAHRLVGALQMIRTAPELMNARLALQVLASSYYQANITSLGFVPCNFTNPKPDDSGALELESYLRLRFLRYSLLDGQKKVDEGNADELLDGESSYLQGSEAVSKQSNQYNLFSSGPYR